MKRLIASCLFFIAATALAQLHPNEAGGFAPDKLYDFHDIDSVNMFNGNLIIRIPIGPSFKVNALISYQYQLVYNSHIWRFDEIDLPETHFVPSPVRAFNAGLGWTLSFGQLKPGSENPAPYNNSWVYETSDGSQHPFFVSLHNGGLPGDTIGYTQDGTYLRMRRISTAERRVDFPDGTTQVFQLLLPVAGAPKWLPSTSADAVWRLVQITSAKSNSVTIDYRRSSSMDFPYYPEIWTVQDTDRSSAVYFANVASDGGNPLPANFPLILRKIELPAPAGHIATYNFHSVRDDTIPTPGYPDHIPCILLKDVQLPAVNGSSAYYSMMDGSTHSYDNGPAYSGELHKLTLPTLGSVRWEYIWRTFPGQAPNTPGISKPVTVYTRQTFQPGASAADATWQYGSQFDSSRQPCYQRCLSDPVTCGNSRQLTTWVMPPRTADPITQQQDPQYATVNYFSIYDPDIDQCGGDPGDPIDSDLKKEYGLPFTRYAQRNATDNDPVVARYLSTQLVKDFPTGFAFSGQGSVAANGGPLAVKSTYVTYDPGVDSGGGGGIDSRLTSSVSLYDVDTGCGGVPCYTATNFFNFDSFGHFKQTSTVSNFPGDDALRTDWKNYATTLNAGGDWVLGTWDKHCVTRDSTPRGAMDPSGNPCPTFSLTAHALFDGATGLLLGQRTLALSGDTTNAHDVVATYGYDQRGYKSRESYFGGDVQSLAGNEFAPSVSPTYEIDYLSTYDPATSKLLGRSGSYAQSGLSVVNETYDTNVGLVSSSSDPAGISTQYSYDDRGRLSTVISPGSATTTFAYTDASYGASFSPATATVSKLSSTAGLVQEEYDYDPFGRLAVERRTLPSGTGVRSTTYAPSGVKQKISEFETAPTHFTVFSGFDAYDHATRITTPDNQVVTVSFGYDPSNPLAPGNAMLPTVRKRTRTVKIATAAGGALTDQSTTETYDVLGRLRSVTEPTGGTVAAYSYDVGGQLVTAAISAGGVSQTRAFTYDNRGFLHAEQSPEAGTAIYNNPDFTLSDPFGYDARGHTRSRTIPDPNGECHLQLRCFDLRYSFDAAERVESVSSRNPLDNQFRLSKEFTYATTDDGINHKKGKLEIAKRHNYLGSLGDVLVTETYEYRDDAGRLTHKTTQISADRGSKTLHQSYEYNDLGLQKAVTYPYCDGAGCGQPTWGDVQSTYTNGLLTAVSQPPFASSIGYLASGMVGSVGHYSGLTQDGTIDTYSVDSNTQMSRPDRITFQSWNDNCAAPHINTQPQNATIFYGDQTTLTVNASGSNLTYQWFLGYGSASPIMGANSATLPVSPTLSTNYWVRIMNGCGRADSALAVVTVQPHAPSFLHVVTQTSSLHVSWSAVSGANHYDLQRLSNNVWTTLSGAPNPYDDVNVLPNTTYVYRVRAIADDSTPSPYSNSDLGTTATFTTITSGTVVAFTHLDELRNLVNFVRAASGKLSVSWSEILNPSNCPGVSCIGYNPASCAGYQQNVPAAAQNVTIFAWHVLALRCAMNNALQSLALPVAGYADPTLTGVPIRVLHVTDIRDHARHTQ